MTPGSPTTHRPLDSLNIMYPSVIQVRFVALASLLFLVVGQAPISYISANNGVENESPLALDGKAILLSTGNDIKIFVESPPSATNHNNNNNNNRMLRDSSSNNGISDSDKWITTIDYYYETPSNSNDDKTTDEKAPLSAQLSVLWLDTNSQNIYKSTIGHTNHTHELLLKSSATTSSSQGSTIYRGSTVNLNTRHKLNLKHHLNDDSSTALQTNISAYDFTIDRAAEKLFVSSESSRGHQLCLMSLTDMDTPERCFALNNGPATCLQVDYLANLIVYLDKSSRMNVINLKTGLRRHLTDIDTDNNDLPVTLTMDKEAKRIYWITGTGAVWSSSYDGTDKRCVTLLKSRRNLLEPFSMKLIKGRLFFSDIKKRSLSSIDIPHIAQHMENCINSQRPESDGVLIVETPTVYSFHFVDLDLSEIRHVQTKTETFVLTPSRLHSPNNNRNNIHHMDISVHSSEHYTKLVDNSSYVKLPTWMIIFICVGLTISIVMIIATIVLIALKKRRNDLDGLKPFINEI